MTSSCSYPRRALVTALSGLSLALLLVLAAPSSGLWADGFIYVHRPHPVPEPHVRPVPPPQHFPMEVTRHRVTIEIDGVAARTRVDETFHNPNNVQLEGEYLFPLPPGAGISGFTMKIGGTEISGEVLEKDKARQIYEQIVRQVKDPGLLEYVERGLFRARVFPIPARGDVEVAIEYSEALRREHGTTTYRYPLDTGKYISGGYKNVVIDLRLRSAEPIRGVNCPSHEQALVSRASDKEVRVSLEAKSLPGNKDLLVNWNVSEDALAPAVLAHRGPESDGFFLLTVAPRAEESKSVVPKDVVFVIDTSGSMLGVKIEQVQKALRYCLEGLNPGDHFSIVDFSTEARRFREGLVEVNDENRRAATAYVDAMKARGGTNIEEAMRFGLEDLKSQDRLSMLVLLTDGEPTIGTITPAEILKTVATRNPQRRRAFVFGVGDDLNAKLLDSIAKETGGTTQYLRPNEDIEVPLSNFFDKIDSPVFTDVELSFPGSDVSDVHPKPLPDVFHGEQLNIFGRYANDGHKSVILKGKLLGEWRVFEYSLPFEPRAEMSFVPRLWAMQKIGYLLEQMRLVGETSEVKEEVVRLSKRYGIITPFTSYLIVEESRLALRAPEAEAAPAGSIRRMRRAASDAIVSGSLPPSRPAEGGAAEAAEADETLDTYRPAYDALKEDGGSRGVEFSRRVGALKDGRGGGEVREFVEERINQGESRIREIGGRTFYLQGARWVDSAILDSKTPDGLTSIQVTYLSDDYFQLLSDEPGIGRLLSVGADVSFLWKGKVVQVNS